MSLVGDNLLMVKYRMMVQNDARMTEEQATKRRSRILGMSYSDTSNPDKRVFKGVLSVTELVQLKVVPMYVDEHHIEFGVTNTTSHQTMDSLRNRFPDQRVGFSLISDSGYRDYMQLFNPPKKIVYEDIKLSAGENDNLFQRVSDSLNQVLADDILAYLVMQAHQLKGSDIHIECQKNEVRIRMRVDGVLHPIAQLSYEKYKQLLSSIAIAANVGTASRDAQTGHINSTYKLATGEEVILNLRVETIPTAYGYDIVMRLFNLKMELLTIDNLGLSDRERIAVDDVINHPTGLVLVVGPTGSGKTTTLYSLLNTLNSPERKIITLEDPIEYFMEGLVQIPAHGDDNDTEFADKLRAVLRLDPDVVMIGEIRDKDTARTALQAALTGHLVLSTFHASSASAALTRMLDSVGINPLFSSAIHLVMAQRLVRRLDDDTKQSYQPDDSIKKHLQTIIDTLPESVPKPSLDGLQLYNPGSSDANPFGYKGQIALREQLPMSEGIRSLLKKSPSEITTDEIEKQAVHDGMITMLQDGILKVIAGQTTIEEVYRVVG